MFILEWVDYFFYRSDTLDQVCSCMLKSVKSNVRGCLLKTQRTLLKNLSLRYKFSKLRSLFLKEVFIIKFHCLWMLSWIYIYILYCTVLFFKFLFYNSYFIIVIILIIVVHECEPIHLIAICLITILARKLNVLIWVTCSLTAIILFILTDLLND